jgi:predicted hotdog family 3-hydroxylacyl-ACP dehydratase|tara:strand:- start:372 stop:776 length:405 start_codon:yes stop_codon:yes gene_type:complete
MDIKLLIPQREPMIMIDNIIGHSNEKTSTSFIIKETNIFVEDGFFHSSGLIEHIAQSSAARMGMETINQGKKPLLGYIASIKNLSVNRLPKIGETILTEIIQTNQINNIIVIRGKSKIDDIVVSNCELKVFIEE